MYESLHSFYYDPHAMSSTPVRSMLPNQMGTHSYPATGGPTVVDATYRSAAAQAPLNPIQNSSSSGYSMSHPLHTPSGGSNFITIRSSSATPPTLPSPGPERKYILFGILDKGPHKLACIDLPCRRTHHAHTCQVYREERDSDFFRDLQETYRNLRGIKRFLLPYTLDEFRFVKVSRLGKPPFPVISEWAFSLIISTSFIVLSNIRLLRLRHL